MNMSKVLFISAYLFVTLSFTVLLLGFAVMCLCVLQLCLEKHHGPYSQREFKSILIKHDFNDF